QTIAHRPFPIANCLAGEVLNVSSCAEQPTDYCSLPARQLAIGNGQWAIFSDHGLRSVVLVILVNSFKISLQSVRIESCSLSYCVGGRRRSLAVGQRGD